MHLPLIIFSLFYSFFYFFSSTLPTTLDPWLCLVLVLSFYLVLLLLVLIHLLSFSQQSAIGSNVARDRCIHWSRLVAWRKCIGLDSRTPLSSNQLSTRPHTHTRIYLTVCPSPIPFPSSPLHEIFSPYSIWPPTHTHVDYFIRDHHLFSSLIFIFITFWNEFVFIEFLPILYLGMNFLQCFLFVFNQLRLFLFRWVEGHTFWFNPINQLFFLYFVKLFNPFFRLWLDMHTCTSSLHPSASPMYILQKHSAFILFGRHILYWFFWIVVKHHLLPLVLHWLIDWNDASVKPTFTPIHPSTPTFTHTHTHTVNLLFRWAA